MSAAEDTPRRQTPSERAHELLRLAMERPAPVSGAPHFHVEQTKATGGATVMEWGVHIPVCDDYPTAERAFDALLSFSDRLAARYPATAANGEPSKTAGPEERTARAAAAIARNKAKAS